MIASSPWNILGEPHLGSGIDLWHNCNIPANFLGGIPSSYLEGVFTLELAKQSRRSCKWADNFLTNHSVDCKLSPEVNDVQLKSTCESWWQPTTVYVSQDWWTCEFQSVSYAAGKQELAVESQTGQWVSIMCSCLQGLVAAKHVVCSCSYIRLCWSSTQVWHILCPRKLW